MNAEIKLQSLNYDGVSLLGGLQHAQFAETVRFLLSISEDGLLHGFRERAGVPAPGKTLTGWYGKQGFIFGQLLGSLAKIFRITGNAAIKSKLDRLIAEWAGCMDSDGYGLYPRRSDCERFAVAYEYEKLLTGLLDAHEYAGNTDALNHAAALTDWAIENFSVKPDRPDYLAEWYTLGEGLYRAYQMTNEKKYLDFARRWEYPDFWDRFLGPTFSLESPRHAYSHVNSLSSAARAYEVTGEPKYLEIIRRAYEEIIKNHTYATGGYGPQEEMFGKPGYLGDSLKSSWDRSLTDCLIRVRHDPQGSCEISCCAWAVFKLCTYLMRFTGEARYGDWAERIMLNGTLAQMPITEDGKIMYYASYYVDGATKSTLDRRYHFSPQTYDALGIGANQGWQCCTGTFPLDVVEYHNLAYFHDSEGIYVCQFLASEARVHIKNRMVQIACATDYPATGSVRYTLALPGRLRFKFHIRVPTWVRRKVETAVNGIRVELVTRPGDWLTIDRDWTDGDSISLDIPFDLGIQPIDSKNPGIAALCSGPLVLVTDDLAVYEGDVEHPEEWIEPSGSGNHSFRTRQGHVEGYDFLTQKFTPYYQVPANQWYFMYLMVRQGSSRPR